MWNRVSDWWNGEYVPYDNEPNSGVVLIGGTQVRHWTSNIAHAVWSFLKKEWKWVFGSILAVTALAIAYLGLP